ncbi:hypothetical protein AAMO2058_000786300 [Amorphochlora amoebiformis]
MEVGLRPRWREAIRPRSSRWMELVPAMNLVLCIALAVLGIAVVGEGDGFRVSSGIHRVFGACFSRPRLTVNANGLPEKISEVEHMSNMTKLDSFTVEEEESSSGVEAETERISSLLERFNIEDDEDSDENQVSEPTRSHQPDTSRDTQKDVVKTPTTEEILIKDTQKDSGKKSPKENIPRSTQKDADSTASMEWPEVGIVEDEDDVSESANYEDEEELRAKLGISGAESRDFGDFEDFEKLGEAVHVPTREVTRDRIPERLPKRAEQKIEEMFTRIAEGKWKDPKAEKDRRTSDHSLDARTVDMLLSLRNKGIFYSLEGNIKTGKESCVFLGQSTLSNQYVALKVYRTSVISFKRKKQYMIGDHRLGGAVKTKNKVKIIKMWAEKEFRNLMRMQKAKVPCPVPLGIKGHVLAMEFLGNTDGEMTSISPPLKEVHLSPEDLQYIYVDVIISMWRMFCRAGIVHGDLSEFNIIFHNGRAYIIDVGQAVLLTHPMAFEFLRRDVQTVNRFFQSRNVPTLTDKELFLLVTDYTLTSTKAIIDLVLESSYQLNRTTRKANEEFKSAFIPAGVESLPTAKDASTLKQISEHYDMDHELVERVIEEIPSKGGTRGGCASKEAEDILDLTELNCEQKPMKKAKRTPEEIQREKEQKRIERKERKKEMKKERRYRRMMGKKEIPAVS